MDNECWMLSFKSDSGFYEKELSGVKNNTVRKNDNGFRFQVLDEFESGKLKKMKIEIVNRQNGNSFTREIKDVSIYKDWYIMTWGGQNESK